jgi:hypothetical protein
LVAVAPSKRELEYKSLAKNQSFMENFILLNLIRVSFVIQEL